jgi:hypothetical protein
MKRKLQAEGTEAVAKRKKTNREYMERCHKAEGIEAVAKCKITRLPASPAAEKKPKQQLNMTAEKTKV